MMEESEGGRGEGEERWREESEGGRRVMEGEG